MIRWLAAMASAASVALPSFAGAFTIENNPPADAAAAYRDLVPAAPKGAIAWETLDKATVAVDPNAKDGVARPRFPDEIAALDGKEVRVKGYVFPLEQALKVKRFLLTAYPPDCPFCLPAGASQMILVESARPLDYTMDPVLVVGQLQLQKTSSDGLLYKMVGGRFESE